MAVVCGPGQICANEHEKYETIKHDLGLPLAPPVGAPVVQQNCMAGAFSPHDHQLIISSFLTGTTNYSLMCWHGLGSGKTLTAILTIIKNKSSSITITPFSLYKNFSDEMSGYRNPQGVLVPGKQDLIRPFLVTPVAGVLQPIRAAAAAAAVYPPQQRQSISNYAGGKSKKTRRYKKYNKRTRGGHLLDSLPGTAISKRLRQMPTDYAHYNTAAKNSVARNPTLRESAFITSHSTDLHCYNYYVSREDFIADKVPLVIDMINASEKMLLVVDEAQILFSSIYNCWSNREAPKIQVTNGDFISFRNYFDALNPTGGPNIQQQIASPYNATFRAYTYLTRLNTGRRVANAFAAATAWHTTSDVADRNKFYALADWITPTPAVKWPTSQSALDDFGAGGNNYNILSCVNKDTNLKLLLLSGTPISQHPSECAILLNILEGERVMAEQPEVFENNYGILGTLHVRTWDSIYRQIYLKCKLLGTHKLTNACATAVVANINHILADPAISTDMTLTKNIHTFVNGFMPIINAAPGNIISISDPAYNIDTFIAAIANPSAQIVFKHFFERVRIRNEDHFKRQFKSVISYFGNIEDLMPPVQILPHYITGHSIFGDTLYNIELCKPSVRQFDNLYYLQFIAWRTGSPGAIMASTMAKDFTLPLDKVDDTFGLFRLITTKQGASSKDVGIDMIKVKSLLFRKLRRLFTTTIEPIAVFPNMPILMDEIREDIAVDDGIYSTPAYAELSNLRDEMNDSIFHNVPTPAQVTAAIDDRNRFIAANPNRQIVRADPAVQAATNVYIENMIRGMICKFMPEYLYNPEQYQELNTKMYKLYRNILANPNSRHIIYSESKPVNILISYMLCMLGYEEYREGDDVNGGIYKFGFLSGNSNREQDEPAPNAEERESETFFGLYSRDNTYGNSFNRGQMIDDFNGSDNFKIVIFTSIIAEGVSLKMVDFIHVFHLPNSISKTCQIIARGIRNCSRPRDRHFILVVLYLMDYSDIPGQALLTSLQRFTGDHAYTASLDSLRLLIPYCEARDNLTASTAVGTATDAQRTLVTDTYNAMTAENRRLIRNRQFALNLEDDVTTYSRLIDENDRIAVYLSLLRSMCIEENTDANPVMW
jgi:hypothetical protein